LTAGELKATHAIPLADGVLAHRHSGITAERRLAAHAETQCECDRCHVAAKATVTDVHSFCDRQPDACTLGSQAAVAIGQRAQAGAKMVYEYFNQHLGSHGAGAANGASAEVTPLPLARPSQHTLSPNDLAPAWRPPPSRKEGRTDRPA